MAGSVGEYLARVDHSFRSLLKSVRSTIRSTAPGAAESITYGIPTYKQDGKRLIYFSAATEHCAVHMIGPGHLAEAKRRGFAVGRGSIRFTPERPIPEDLLKRIVKARLAEIAAGSRTC